MSEQFYFDSSPTTPPTLTPPTFPKPVDSFNVSAPPPNTLFYLAIIKPHLDSYELHGPTQAFTHLLPKITDIISNSPLAIDKLDELKCIEDIWGERSPNAAFFENGFDTFIVEGQRGVYTVLKVLREVNQEVCEALPSPVYTVTAAGPLVQVPSFRATLSRPGRVERAKGHAATTRVVGSFVERKEAKRVAGEVMKEMVAGVEEEVKHSEQWEAGSKGAGMLMAMAPGRVWEVRIGYEDQVHRRAKEGFDWEGEMVGWRF